MTSLPIQLLAVVLLIIAVSARAEQGYQRLSRDLHNQHRSRHHVGALNSNEDLHRRAVTCAQYYANKGTIDHSCPHKNGAGENLWAQWGGSPTNHDAARNSANSWYSESRNYNYNSDYVPGTGHFTQMVWKSSRDYGFGTGRKGNMIVGCSLYNPHGNVIGQFRNNVLRP